MSLRIGNMAALNSNRQLRKTHAGLESSVARLASGLRINRAADDSSGLVIADSLNSQARGLGQAVKNANDAVSIIQVADAALEESINIINTIKSKSIQAAQDGQTLESRRAIQLDVDKLLTELDNIAGSTSFNGQKLLTGTFINKDFQVGAYRGETAGVSISSAQASKIGHLTTGVLSLDNGGEGVVDLGITDLDGNLIPLAPVNIAYENDPSKGMGVLADAINRIGEKLGINARASVVSKSSGSIRAGITGPDFSINSVPVSPVRVLENDADGSLVKAINSSTSRHGVTAGVDEDGVLTLTSNDHRPIEVVSTPGGATDGVLNESRLSTTGSLLLSRKGAGTMGIRDMGSGTVIATADGNMEARDPVWTTVDSTIRAGSTLAENSILKSPWTTQGNIYGDIFADDVRIGEPTMLERGSVLGQGSVVLSHDPLGGTAKTAYASSTTEESLVKAGSVLEAGSVLAPGTVLPAGNMVSANTVFKGDANVEVTASTTGPGILRTGSQLTAGSVIASGSVLTGNASVQTLPSLSLTGEIHAGSTLAAGSILAPATIIEGDASVSAITGTAGTINLTAGSFLANGSFINNGTTLAGDAVIAGPQALNGNYSLGGNSFLRTGSVLGNGTTLNGNAQVQALGPTTGPYTLAAGSRLLAGSFLPDNTTLQGAATVGLIPSSAGADITLAAGTLLAPGTVIDSGFTVNTTGGPLTGVVTGPGTVTTTGINTFLLDSASIAAGTVLATGSVVGATGITLDGAMDLTGGMTLPANGSIAGGSRLNTGSVAGPEKITLDVSMTTGGPMTVGAGSVLASNSILRSGSSIGPDGITLNATMNITGAMALQAGSNIVAGSVFHDNSAAVSDPLTLSSTLTVNSVMTLTANSRIQGGSSLATGSSIASDRIILAGTLTAESDMTLNTGSVVGNNSLIKYGSTIGADATLLSTITLDEYMDIASPMPLASDLILGTGSTLGEGSVIDTGSLVYLPLELLETMAIGTDMLLERGSEISNDPDTRILAETLVGGDATLSRSLIIRKDMEFNQGGVLGRGSVLKNGSDIGGPLITGQREVVKPGAPMDMGAGSVLAGGSILGAGTFLTSDIMAEDGKTYRRGVTLSHDIITRGENRISSRMTLEHGAIARGSKLAAVNNTDTVSTRMDSQRMYRLSDLNILSQEDAQTAISISSSALGDLDRTRADLGSVQNQLTSTLSNIRSTRVNIKMAESTIRDVDFASESSNLSRVQILSESGVFALSQANASASAIMSLLEEQAG